MIRNFLVFYPSFYNNNGHESVYLDLLKNISKRYNLSLKIFVPKNSTVENNTVILKKLDEYKKKFFYSLPYIIKNLKNIKLIIKKSSNSNIFFLDTQIILFHICIFFLIFFSKIKVSFLILIIRGNPNHIKFLFYKLILKILNKKKFKIKVFVDNSNIKKFLKKNYNITSQLLPTFHYIKYNYKKNKEKNRKKNKEKKLYLLCPGSFRKEKYGKNLIDFLNFYDDKKTILKINEKSDLKKENSNLKIIYFKDNLKRDDYDNLFLSSDVILLPYDSTYYQNRSSGIFFESIKAKKILFVTSKTIMAHELKKAKLSPLLIPDWKKLNSKKIYFVLNSKKIKKNLYKLSKIYNLNNSLNRTIAQFSFLKN